MCALCVVDRGSASDSRPRDSGKHVPRSFTLLLSDGFPFLVKTRIESESDLMLKRLMRALAIHVRGVRRRALSNRGDA